MTMTATGPPASPFQPILGPLRLLFHVTLIFSWGMVANAVFLLSAFIYPIHPGFAYELTSLTAGSLWTWMQYVFEGQHKAVVTFSGDRVPDGENAIIIANHLSYSDYYLINALALRKGMLHYCRWFAKHSLIYQLPIFGLSMYLMGMVMVKRDWLKDSASTREAFLDLKKPEGKGKKVWIVTFLEGTRRTEKKLKESQQFCEKRGKPVLQNVLFPRTKGFVAAVQELRGSQVTHVYDLTLAYRSPKGFASPPLLTTIHSLPHLTPHTNTTSTSGVSPSPPSPPPPTV